MKQIKTSKQWKFLKRKWKKIHLVDRCLLIFMLILMLQTAYNLFANEASAQEANTIDIIVRTSAAAIFGYFISANFSHTAVPQENLEPIPEPVLVPIASYVQESLPLYSEPEPVPIVTVQEEPKYIPMQGSNDTTQIIVVSVIGLIALFILLLFRNFFDTAGPATAGTLSQLRDFVSGCVGFLVSCSTQDTHHD